MGARTENELEDSLEVLREEAESLDWYGTVGTCEV